MKKILMFQDYFYNGGIEKVILNIKNNLDSNYFVDIVSLVNKSNEDIISLLNREYKSFFRRNLLGLKKYKMFLKNNMNSYDIIHIHCYNAFGFIYAFIAKKYFNKIIVHAHNSGIDKDYFYIKHIINSIIKIIFKSKKYVFIAVSEEANKFCFNCRQTIILPNGINYNDFYYNSNLHTEYRKQFNIKHNEIVIGHIGRFNKQKNHTFIIDIFNEICKNRNNYKLILVGEGPLKEKIKKKVKKLQLDNNVVFLNNRNDLSKFINMFDIYLYPSIYEGFGLTVIENEVNGKYVYVSDVLTSLVKISNRLEFISLNNNAKYWANKILRLKQNNLNIDHELSIKKYCKCLTNIYRGFYEKD